MSGPVAGPPDAASAPSSFHLALVRRWVAAKRLPSIIRARWARKTASTTRDRAFRAFDIWLSIIDNRLSSVKSGRHAYRPGEELAEDLFADLRPRQDHVVQRAREGEDRDLRPETARIARYMAPVEDYVGL